jgi:hypothetical protein
MALLKKPAAPPDAQPAEPDPDAVEISDVNVTPETPAAEAAVLEPQADILAAEPDAGPAAGTDALLDMFATTGLEGEDKSALLDLAGEVDLDDIIEELQTVAAALGISCAPMTSRRLAA